MLLDMLDVLEGGFMAVEFPAAMPVAVPVAAGAAALCIEATPPWCEQAPFLEVPVQVEPSLQVAVTLVAVLVDCAWADGGTARPQKTASAAAIVRDFSILFLS